MPLIRVSRRKSLHRSETARSRGTKEWSKPTDFVGSIVRFPAFSIVTADKLPYSLLYYLSVAFSYSRRSFSTEKRNCPVIFIPALAWVLLFAIYETCGVLRLVIFDISLASQNDCFEMIVWMTRQIWDIIFDKKS